MLTDGVSPDPTEALLMAAAFGDAPGCWPLPAASTPSQLWLRAVAAGGQGRYGSAQTDLATLRRLAATGPLASLAHSTHASFLRQLGGHAAARRWDGRARAVANRNVEAGVDAVIGLAADALGIKRFAASAALLDRARAVLDDAGDAPHRLALRLAWVSAELAMVSGDGPGAVLHADVAREIAATSASLRHRVKTEMVLAAALCSAGRIGQAREVAEAALTATERLGLMPLQWALASLLADVGGERVVAGEARAVRDRCAAELQRRGGVWHR